MRDKLTLTEDQLAKLQKLRDSKGYSADGISKHIEKSPSWYRKFEKGVFHKRKIERVVLQKILAYLHDVPFSKADSLLQDFLEQDDPIAKTKHEHRNILLSREAFLTGLAENNNDLSIELDKHLQEFSEQVKKLFQENIGNPTYSGIICRAIDYLNKNLKNAPDLMLVYASARVNPSHFSNYEYRQLVEQALDFYDHITQKNKNYVHDVLNGFGYASISEGAAKLKKAIDILKELTFIEAQEDLRSKLDNIMRTPLSLIDHPEPLSKIEILQLYDRLLKNYNMLDEARLSHEKYIEESLDLDY